MTLDTLDRLRDEELFELHSEGKIPPLVDREDPRLGLVNGHLLEIYQRGFSGVHSTPLGILLADIACQEPEDHWRRGNYHYNELAKKDWTSFCTTVREFSPDGNSKPGDRACEECDRKWALLAEKSQKAIAYICCHGMIDFAVPVRVGKQTTAVLFTGQLRPKGDCHWPEDLLVIWNDEKQCVEPAVDVCRLCDERIGDVARKYGIPEERLSEAFEADKRASRATPVTPEQIRAKLHDLDYAAALLSNLATTTYELQKLRLASLLRFELGMALAEIDDTLSNIDEGLSKVQGTLEKFANLMGLDHVFVSRLSIENDQIAGIQLISAAGPHELEISYSVQRIPKRWLFGAPARQLAPTIHELDLARFPGVPFFQILADKYADAGHNHGKPICVTPVPTPKLVVIIGRLGADLLSAADEGTMQSIAEISATTCLVCQTFLLLKDIRKSQQGMDRFIEDLAHDIRSPIHNIITKVGVLKRWTGHPQYYVSQASKLGAAVMRIELVARRVWTAQMLHRGELEYKMGVSASVQETAATAADALADLSAHERVDVVLELDELRRLGALNVDPDLFFEVILNLLHNGIKYSRPPIAGRNAQVLLKGFRRASETCLSVGNRGIQIREEEKGRIFERYYRTPTACRFKPEGSGIGLSIVKDFADHYGAEIDVTSEPISGTSDYLTVFTLRLKKGS